MKSILGMILICCTLGGFAQEKKETATKTDWSKLDLSKRASDHFMFQLGYAGWGGKGDINTKGFSRTFNMYFMFDFSFKSNPKLSVAVGPGVGTDNIFFDKTKIDLAGNTGATFTADSITQYKKNKLATGYLELPLELRYSTKPEDMNSGWKLALGMKIGTIVDGKVKSKIDLDASNKGGYFLKTKDRRNLNGTRLAATFRAGYGNMSFFGTYTLTEFFKAGFGPDVKPFTIGIAVSGL
jgi:hypothetical protein